MALAIKGPRKTYKSLDDKIGFGMYADKTISDLVYHSGQSYLIWMHNNTNNKLGKRLIKEIEAIDEKYIGKFK